MQSKIIKIIKHIHHGTLIEAVKNRLKAYKRKKSEEKWKRCKVRGNSYKFKLHNGVIINLYPDDKLSELIFRGNFELAEQEFVRNYLYHGDIFVDVGANIGLFTLIAAKKVGLDGRVIAFEPTKLTYERLLKNIKLNKFENVRCIQVALSDKVEDRIFNMSIDGYGAWNSLANPTAGEQFNQEIIPCTTWDKFSSENHLTGKTTLMKIDIEGWEFYALNGATQTLSRNDAPDILIEFTDANAQSAGTSCEAVYNRLIDVGYEMYYVDATNLTLGREALRREYPYVNLLATKRIAFVCERSGYSVVG